MTVATMNPRGGKVQGIEVDLPVQSLVTVYVHGRRFCDSAIHVWHRYIHARSRSEFVQVTLSVSACWYNGPLRGLSK